MRRILILFALAAVTLFPATAMWDSTRPPHVQPGIYELRPWAASLPASH